MIIKNHQEVLADIYIVLVLIFYEYLSNIYQLIFIFKNMKSFQLELNKKSKKQLVPIVQALGLNSQRKKEQCIDCILNKIGDIFERNRKSRILDDQTINQIEQTIEKKTREGAQFVKRCLKKMPEIDRADPNRRFISKQFVKNLMSEKCCFCLNPVSQIGLNAITCIYCKTVYHQNCFVVSKSQSFECPFCFSRSMDPLNQVQKTLFQGYLNMKQKIQKIQFRLTEQQLHNDYEVQIRSIRLDGKNNYQLSWPDVGTIDINNNKLLEFKPLANNSSLKRRKDQAKTIEYKYLQKINNLVLNFNNTTAYPVNKYRITFIHVHFIGIFLVKPLKIQQLVQKILQKPISIQKSNLLLGAQFSQFKQLSIQRVDINLTCAYSATAIKIPARGVLCKHFKCFDLRNMICAISFSRRWKCPICKERVHEIIVDPILSDIIKNNSQNRIKQVSFQRDGQYKITYEVQDSEDESGHDQMQNGNQKMTQMINLDSDIEEQINVAEKQQLEEERQQNNQNNMGNKDYEDQHNNQRKNKMDIQLQSFQYELQKSNQNSQQINQSQILNQLLLEKKNNEKSPTSMQRQIQLNHPDHTVNQGINQINQINQQVLQNQQFNKQQLPSIVSNLPFAQQTYSQQFKQKKQKFQPITNQSINSSFVRDKKVIQQINSTKFSNKKINILPDMLQAKATNIQNVKQKKQSQKNRLADTIIILDSDEETDQYREKKQIMAEFGLIKDLTKKFQSQSLKFQKKDMYKFLTLAEKFL